MSARDRSILLLKFAQDAVAAMGGMEKLQGIVDLAASSN